MLHRTVRNRGAAAEMAGWSVARAWVWRGRIYLSSGATSAQGTLAEARACSQSCTPGAGCCRALSSSASLPATSQASRWALPGSLVHCSTCKTARSSVFQDSRPYIATLCPSMTSSNKQVSQQTPASYPLPPNGAEQAHCKLQHTQT